MAKISIRPGASEAERQAIDKLARLLNTNCPEREFICVRVLSENLCVSEDYHTQRSAERSESEAQCH